MDLADSTNLSPAGPGGSPGCPAEAAPIDDTHDVTDIITLSKAAAITERLLLDWCETLDRSPLGATPAALNLSIDTLGRLTAIRKSLIHMKLIVDRAPQNPSFVVPPSGEIPPQATRESNAPGNKPSESDPQHGPTLLVPAVPLVPLTPQSEIRNPQLVHIPIPPSMVENFSEIPQSAIRNPQSSSLPPLATFPPEDAVRHPILQSRPALYLNHGTPALACPDRAPSLRGIREIARIPFNRLLSSLTKTIAAIKTLPEATKPHIHPKHHAAYDSLASIFSRSISSIFTHSSVLNPLHFSVVTPRHSLSP